MNFNSYWDKIHFSEGYLFSGFMVYEMYKLTKNYLDVKLITLNNNFFTYEI